VRLNWRVVESGGEFAGLAENALIPQVGILKDVSSVGTLITSGRQRASRRIALISSSPTIIRP